MNKGEIKSIIGIERGVNKKYGTPFTILHTVCDFDEYATTNRDAQGSRVENTYIRGNIPCNVGDEVKFQYQPGFNNEAVVSGIEVIKSE